MCWLCEKTKGKAHLDDCRTLWGGMFYGSTMGYGPPDYWLGERYCYNFRELFYRPYIRLLILWRRLTKKANA